MILKNKLFMALCFINVIATFFTIIFALLFSYRTAAICVEINECYTINAWPFYYIAAVLILTGPMVSKKVFSK